MHSASHHLSRLPREPNASTMVAAYLRKPPFAVAASLIVLSFPLLLVSTLLFALTSEAAKTWSDTVALIFILYSWSAGPLIAGIILLIYPVLIRAARRISDEDFDRQLAKDVYSLSQRALHKIQINVPGAGIEMGQFPDTVVSAPNLWCTGCTGRNQDLWGDFDDSFPSWKKGKDGNIRYRIYRIAILYLASHHLAYYICDFNAETGLILWEETVDCHYKDVAAINFEETQLRIVDLPRWWWNLNDAMGIFKISQLFQFLLQRTMIALSLQSDLNVRNLEIFLTNGKVRIPTRITEFCNSFNESCTVDPVVSKVRFLLQQKRMSYVRMLEAGEGI